MSYEGLIVCGNIVVGIFPLTLADLLESI